MSHCRPNRYWRARGAVAGIAAVARAREVPHCVGAGRIRIAVVHAVRALIHIHARRPVVVVAVLVGAVVGVCAELER